MGLERPWLFGLPPLPFLDTGRVPVVEAGEMESTLGLRLGAEALGTFLFFFLGFDAFAARLPRGGPSRV